MDPQRQAVLAEAERWLKTPYHHMARVRGTGVDCLTLLVEVYQRAGIVGPIEVPFYRPDFMCHRDDETYLEGLLAHGREVAIPEPADVVLYKWGRVFAHAGIVVGWPQIIHADPKNGVIRGDGLQGRLGGRPIKFISPF